MFRRLIKKEKLPKERLGVKSRIRRISRKTPSKHSKHGQTLKYKQHRIFLPKIRAQNYTPFHYKKVKSSKRSQSTRARNYLHTPSKIQGFHSAFKAVKTPKPRKQKSKLS